MKLGWITNLSDDIVLDGFFSTPPVALSSQQCLGYGGVEVVDVWPLDVATDLYLQAENHLTLAELKSIDAMARLGEPVELVHHRGVFNVLITSIEADPVFYLADPPADHWYSAKIYLKRIIS